MSSRSKQGLKRTTRSSQSSAGARRQPPQRTSRQRSTALESCAASMVNPQSRLGASDNSWAHELSSSPRQTQTLPSRNDGPYQGTSPMASRINLGHDHSLDSRHDLLVTSRGEDFHQKQTISMMQDKSSSDPQPHMDVHTYLRTMSSLFLNLPSQPHSLSELSVIASKHQQQQNIRGQPNASNAVSYQQKQKQSSLQRSQHPLISLDRRHFSSKPSPTPKRKMKSTSSPSGNKINLFYKPPATGQGQPQVESNGQPSGPSKQSSPPPPAGNPSPIGIPLNIRNHEGHSSPIDEILSKSKAIPGVDESKTPTLTLTSPRRSASLSQTPSSSNPSSNKTKGQYEQFQFTSFDSIFPEDSPGVHTLYKISVLIRHCDPNQLDQLYLLYQRLLSDLMFLQSRVHIPKPLRAHNDQYYDDQDDLFDLDQELELSKLDKEHDPDTFYYLHLSKRPRDQKGNEKPLSTMEIIKLALGANRGGDRRGDADTMDTTTPTTAAAKRPPEWYLEDIDVTHMTFYHSQILHNIFDVTLYVDDSMIYYLTLQYVHQLLYKNHPNIHYNPQYGLKPSPFFVTLAGLAEQAALEQAMNDGNTDHENGLEEDSHPYLNNKVSHKDSLNNRIEMFEALTKQQEVQMIHFLEEDSANFITQSVFTVMLKMLYANDMKTVPLSSIPAYFPETPRYDATPSTTGTAASAREQQEPEGQSEFAEALARREKTKFTPQLSLLQRLNPFNKDSIKDAEKSLGLKDTATINTSSAKSTDTKKGRRETAAAAAADVDTDQPSLSHRILTGPNSAFPVHNIDSHQSLFDSKYYSLHSMSTSIHILRGIATANDVFHQMIMVYPHLAQLLKDSYMLCSDDSELRMTLDFYIKSTPLLYKHRVMPDFKYDFIWFLQEMTAPPNHLGSIRFVQDMFPIIKHIIASAAIQEAREAKEQQKLLEKQRDEKTETPSSKGVPQSPRHPTESQTRSSYPIQADANDDFEWDPTLFRQPPATSKAELRLRDSANRTYTNSMHVIHLSLQTTLHVFQWLQSVGAFRFEVLSSITELGDITQIIERLLKRGKFYDNDIQALLYCYHLSTVPCIAMHLDTTTYLGAIPRCVSPATVELIFHTIANLFRLAPISYNIMSRLEKHQLVLKRQEELSFKSNLPIYPHHDTTKTIPWYITEQLKMIRHPSFFYLLTTYYIESIHLFFTQVESLLNASVNNPEEHQRLTACLKAQRQLLQSVKLDTMLKSAVDAVSKSNHIAREIDSADISTQPARFIARYLLTDDMMILMDFISKYAEDRSPTSQQIFQLSRYRELFTLFQYMIHDEDEHLSRSLLDNTPLRIASGNTVLLDVDDHLTTTTSTPSTHSSHEQRFVVPIDPILQKYMVHPHHVVFFHHCYDVLYAQIFRLTQLTHQMRVWNQMVQTLPPILSTVAQVQTYLLAGMLTKTEIADGIRKKEFFLVHRKVSDELQFQYIKVSRDEQDHSYLPYDTIKEAKAIFYNQTILTDCDSLQHQYKTLEQLLYKTILPFADHLDGSSAANTPSSHNHPTGDVTSHRVPLFLSHIIRKFHQFTLVFLKHVNQCNIEREQLARRYDQDPTASEVIYNLLDTIDNVPRLTDIDIKSILMMTQCTPYDIVLVNKFKHIQTVFVPLLLQLTVAEEMLYHRQYYHHEPTSSMFSDPVFEPNAVSTDEHLDEKNFAHILDPESQQSDVSGQKRRERILTDGKPSVSHKTQTPYPLSPDERERRSVAPTIDTKLRSSSSPTTDFKEIEALLNTQTIPIARNDFGQSLPNDDPEYLKVPDEALMRDDEDAFDDYDTPIVLLRRMARLRGEKRRNATKVVQPTDEPEVFISANVTDHNNVKNDEKTSDGKTIDAIIVETPETETHQQEAASTSSKGTSKTKKSKKGDVNQSKRGENKDGSDNDDDTSDDDYDDISYLLYECKTLLYQIRDVEPYVLLRYDHEMKQIPRLFNHKTGLLKDSTLRSDPYHLTAWQRNAPYIPIADTGLFEPNPNYQPPTISDGSNALITSPQDSDTISTPRVIIPGMDSDGTILSRQQQLQKMRANARTNQPDRFQYIDTNDGKVLLQDTASLKMSPLSSGGGADVNDDDIDDDVDLYISTDNQSDGDENTNRDSRDKKPSSSSSSSSSSKARSDRSAPSERNTPNKPTADAVDYDQIERNRQQMKTKQNELKQELEEFQMPPIFLDLTSLSHDDLSGQSHRETSSPSMLYTPHDYPPTLPSFINVIYPDATNDSSINDVIDDL